MGCPVFPARLPVRLHVRKHVGVFPPVPRRRAAVGRRRSRPPRHRVPRRGRSFQQYRFRVRRVGLVRFDVTRARQRADGLQLGRTVLFQSGQRVFLGPLFGIPVRPDDVLRNVQRFVVAPTRLEIHVEFCLLCAEPVQRSAQCRLFAVLGPPVRRN